MARSWTYGINPHHSFRYGTIYLREEPWWLSLSGWIIDILGYGFRYMHWIPLPTFFYLTDDDGVRVSWNEYWGNVGVLWHLFVYDPLFQWYEKNRRSKTFDVEVGYDKVKELFGEMDAEFFSDHENVVDI